MLFHLLHLVILLFICCLKYNLEPNTKPSCFWLSATWTFIRLKWKGGYFPLLRVLEKHTSIACLFGSRLKDLFHWKAHLLIFVKSEFSWQFELLLSLISENKDVSSAKILHFEVNSSSKWLTSIWNSIDERFKQHWGWVEKNVAPKKAWVLRELLWQFNQTQICQHLAIHLTEGSRKFVFWRVLDCTKLPPLGDNIKLVPRF